MKLFDISGLLDFILPRICASCKIKLNSCESFICAECRSNLERASDKRLRMEFKRKFEDLGLINEFISPYVFQEDSVLQNIIHSFKYDQNYHIGKFLAAAIYKHFAVSLNKFEADYLVPVPLHPLRKAERGYNQAAEIGKRLSKLVGADFKPGIVKRNKFTKTQTKFSLLERKRNIEGAFKFNSKYNVKNKNIILVDDVITTGATISECANVLKQNKAGNVYAVSAAIAD